MPTEVKAKERRRSPPRTLEVVHKDMITPHMLRVTLGGSGLRGFPDDPDSAYIKLRLSRPEGGEPVIRTYTVRHYDPQRSELDIDFVVHDADGPAINWARSCEPGDRISISGPGPKKLVDYTADWFLLVGDMSALPAISANIEGMPANAKGYVILEVIDEADQQPLPVPGALEVKWIVNSHPDRGNTYLLDAVRDLEWLTGRPSIWVAGEFSQSIAIRKFVKKKRNVKRDAMYASSYWQIGQTEDGHRVSKRNAESD